MSSVPALSVKPHVSNTARQTAQNTEMGHSLRRISFKPRAVARPRWQSRLALIVASIDIATVLLVLGVAWAAGYQHWLSVVGTVTLPTGPVAAALVVISLFVTRAWDPTVLGQGSEEFSRVVRATVMTSVALGLVGLAAEDLGVRPWVFGMVPVTGLLMITARWVVRKRLHALRRAGRYSLPLLAVGSDAGVADLIARTRRDIHTGWTVTAACTPTGTGPDGGPTVLGVPVVGDLDSVQRVVREARHRVVSVSAAPGLTGTRLHQLAWDLEDVGAELVVDPGLMEVAGPRLHVTPVDGLPLLRLTQPTFSGVARIVKASFDRVGSALLLLLLLPVMVAISIAVKCDGGPVFYRQSRVGLHGSAFSMIKFRSMGVDADRRLAELAGLNEGSGPLFKLRHDPRVTKVGGWLRRYSLDELPQLFNVLLGSMSLVGPRPPLPAEVESYSRDASRKFLVKPGLTGLWQVSGRSNLSWEESVRLDLRYVENWTLAQDAQILWKTFGAVTRKSGAY
jgi:exopolysaccharide biosynthesis polyprenyl glycosylphosphotransferase